MPPEQTQTSRFDATAQKYNAAVSLGLSALCLATVATAFNEMRAQTVAMAGVGAVSLAIWGTVVLLLARRGRIIPRLRYPGTLLPLFFLTLLKLSFMYGKLGYGGVIKDQLSFDAYFLIVVLSACYNDRRLTLLAGVGAALCNVLLIAVGIVFFGLQPTSAVEAAVDVGRVRLAIELFRCGLFVAVAMAMNVFTGYLQGLLDEVRRSEFDAREVLGTLARIEPQIQQVLAPIRQTAQGLASSANAQAASSQFIGGATSDLAANAHQSALSAGETRGIAEQTRADAVAGNERLSTVRAGFGKALGRVEAVDGRLALLGEALDRTEAINDAISDISDGLRYLAVNASLEAAKAGESGAGFAIIAREIHRLVQETGNDLARSRDVLGDIRKQVGSLAGEASQATSHLRASVGELEAAGTLVEKVVASFEKTAKQVETIASASDEQAVGLNEISLALADFDHGASKLNAASATLLQGVEQIAQAHDELATMLRAADDAGDAGEAQQG